MTATAADRADDHASKQLKQCRADASDTDVSSQLADPEENAVRGSTDIPTWAAGVAVERTRPLASRHHRNLGEPFRKIKQISLLRRVARRATARRFARVSMIAR